jgi:hypothetical protein
MSGVRTSLRRTWIRIASAPRSGASSSRIAHQGIEAADLEWDRSRPAGIEAGGDDPLDRERQLRVLMVSWM